MRETFSSLSYVQTGDFCVLASYAVAVWPSVRVTPHSYFVAYCETSVSRARLDVPSRCT